MLFFSLISREFTDKYSVFSVSREDMIQVDDLLLESCNLASESGYSESIIREQLQLLMLKPMMLKTNVGGLNRRVLATGF